MRANQTIRNYATVVLMCLLLAGGNGICSEEPPKLGKKVVDEAASAIDACYHWGGEVGNQSKERNKEISDGINRDCPGAKEKALKAYKLYPKNSFLAAKLIELIDVGYFSATDVDKRGICETAATEFKAEFLKSHQKNFLFQGECPEQAAILYGK